MRTSLRGGLLRAAIDPIVNAIQSLKHHAVKRYHQIERLEPRQLLSTVPGSVDNDEIHVLYTGRNITSIKVNGVAQSNFSEPVTIDGLAGDDRLFVTFDST